MRRKVIGFAPVLGGKYSPAGQQLELSCGHSQFVCRLEWWRKPPKTTICNTCEKLKREGGARTVVCPRCGELVVQCRYTGDYCEECGWPGEDFGGPNG